MKRPPNSYWDKRAQQRMASYHRSADSTVAAVTTAYDKGLRDINTEIEKIFATFGVNGKLDPMKARRVLNQHIPNPLLNIAKFFYPHVKSERIRRWMLNKMNAPAYRARITRLQALREHIYLQSKIIADAEIAASTAGYIKTIETDRDSLAGDDILINRQAFVLHPRGIKWTDTTVSGPTPSNTEAALAANWKRVYESKAIRIVKFVYKLE